MTLSLDTNFIGRGPTLHEKLKENFDAIAGELPTDIEIVNTTFAEYFVDSDRFGRTKAIIVQPQNSNLQLEFVAVPDNEHPPAGASIEILYRRSTYKVTITAPGGIGSALVIPEGKTSTVKKGGRATITYLGNYDFQLSGDLEDETEE